MENSKLPEVLTDADKVLEEYANMLREQRELITDVELAAKDLFKEVHQHCQHDKQEFDSKTMDSKAAQAELDAVVKNQEGRWNILNSKTDKLLSEAQEKWAKVEEAKRLVEEARTTQRDNKFAAAWGSFPTEEQAAIRNYYSKKLLPNFQEAETRHKGLVSYPDGKLLMVRLYQKQANEEMKRTIEMMEGREVQKQLLDTIRAS